MVQDADSKFLKQASFQQMLAWALGILGGGAALFYALGYTIVNTYIRRVGLEGMFWLTDEFYTDAGAQFLLDMARAPLLAPHLFFGYLFLLSVLVPREMASLAAGSAAELGRPVGRNRLKSLQWLRLAIIFTLIIMTYIVTSYFTVVRQSPLFLSVMRTVSIFDANHALLSSSKSSMEASLAFFSLVTPLVLFFGNYLVRTRSILTQRSKQRRYYNTALIVFVVFLAGIPISYANHLYDWKIVPIKDPRIVEGIIYPGRINPPAGPQIGSEFDFGETPSRIWLLGQSDDEYLFLSKADIFSAGVIEVVDAAKIDHLNFYLDPDQIDFLSEQIQPIQSLEKPSEGDAIEYLKLYLR